MLEKFNEIGDTLLLIACTAVAIYLTVSATFGSEHTDWNRLALGMIIMLGVRAARKER